MDNAACRSLGRAAAQRPSGVVLPHAGRRMWAEYLPAWVTDFPSSLERNGTDPLSLEEQNPWNPCDENLERLSKEVNLF